MIVLYPLTWNVFLSVLHAIYQNIIEVEHNTKKKNVLNNIRCGALKSIFAYCRQWIYACLQVGNDT